MLTDTVSLVHIAQSLRENTAITANTESKSEGEAVRSLTHLTSSGLLHHVLYHFAHRKLQRP
jgi:hypothetical protein